MSILQSNVQTGSSDFKSNQAHHLAEAEKLETQLAKIREGGGVELKKKHESRGKLFVRDRIQKLIDPGTPFLELGSLAAFDMYEGSAPGAGVVTGVGLVHGREVMIIANDATVKGGTYFPMTVKKHLRAQEVARENHLPCV